MSLNCYHWDLYICCSLWTWSMSLNCYLPVALWWLSEICHPLVDAIAPISHLHRPWVLLVFFAPVHFSFIRLSLNLETTLLIFLGVMVSYRRSNVWFTIQLNPCSFCKAIPPINECYPSTLLSSTLSSESNERMNKWSIPTYFTKSQFNTVSNSMKKAYVTCLINGYAAIAPLKHGAHGSGPGGHLGAPSLRYLLISASLPSSGGTTCRCG